MHICFLTNEYPHPKYPHGGVGTFVQTLARALVERGIRVTVLGIGYEFRDIIETDHGVRVIRLRQSRWPRFRAFDHAKRLNDVLMRLHAQEPIDVVEAPELGFAFVRKIPDVRYLIRMHGGHHFFSQAENRRINPWKAFQERLSFRKADAVIGVSEYVVKHTLKYIRFEKKFRGVIYNPVDTKRFYKADPAKVIPGRILFVGTLCEKKGIRQLVQAMPKIRKYVPQAHLIVIGRDSRMRGSGRSYREYLKQYITSSLVDTIRFLGHLPNEKLPVEIEKSAVCCYPSHMEAMPVAWLEAMVMGKPFVGSSLGPGPEIIRHGETGLLCNPLDPDDIAEKVIYMLTHTKEAALMGEAARQFVLKNFSIEIIVEKNIALYKSLLCTS